MAADGISSASIWAIFYHFFLNQTDYDFLRFQCQQLLMCSTDLNTWKASKYGLYIRFSTDRTLSEVRRHWSLYLGFEDLPKTEKLAIHLSFAEKMKVMAEHNKGTLSHSCFRAAGPLCLLLEEVASKSHVAFWATGTVDKPQDGLNAFSGISSVQHMNPMFVYSLRGTKFNVHYGTDPLAAFHLSPAAAGANVQNWQPNSLPHKPDLSEAAQVAKAQFDLWCLSFKERVFVNSTEPKLVIRFHAGDAFAFAHALHAYQQNYSTQSGIYTSQWGGSQIILDRSDYSADNAYSAPVSFNVIDTSNLTDHFGLINILTATVPLLQQKPWAVLHTNTLLPRDPSLTLRSLALGDLPTLSMLLGVVPSIHRSPFTTLSNKHEIFICLHNSGPLFVEQWHDYISWKPLLSVAASPVEDPTTHVNQSVLPTWDAAGLARFFFALYLEMFQDENSNRPTGNVTFSGLTSWSPGRYTRESLVALFALVKERAEVDWTKFMATFDQLLMEDRQLLMGRNNYQDFIYHLYLRNIYTMQSMDAGFLAASPGVANLGVFQGWKSVPPAVCVVLKVPRHHLKVLEDMDPDVLMTPFLQCETHAPSFHNIHSSIRPIFGEIVMSSVDGEPSININEDLRGWEGDSDLIVTFFMPSWILLRHSLDSFHVGLYIKSTPQSTHTLVPKLGLQLSIYMTKASNTANVYFVRCRPNDCMPEMHETRPPHVQQPSISSVRKPQRQTVVNFNPAGTKVTTISIRDNISDSAVRLNLFHGASVVSGEVADNVVRVDIDDYTMNFIYPFRIIFNRMILRVARKSSYIEVEVPIRPDFDDTRILHAHDVFPLAFDGNLPVVLLNIHYLHLEKLPALHIPVGRPMDADFWMSAHLGMTLSNSEKNLEKLVDQKKKMFLLNLKQSINGIFLTYAASEHRPCVFGLQNLDVDNMDPYALIFINDIRLDLSAQTIVADACVVRLDESLRPKFAKDLMKLSILMINTLNDETLAWIKLLPALAERCRTWKHSDQCEYIQEGSMAGLKAQKSGPLCSCGKGKNLGPFLKVTDWTSFQPEATRIAISPLFTHSKEYEAIVQSSPRPKSTACASCGKSRAPSILFFVLSEESLESPQIRLHYLMKTKSARDLDDFIIHSL
ncbi:hypothetical protein JR316_0004339 [Psilocybe cubensis]|uniref:Uncharacterized protein n=1 Tax=Psilocybe cubensis TaxID=181762 RepID=A0ACB8H2Z5_PSICU|nr:hypothetical protein JR316_0004339 [Psilocybe cubensis]KAH9482241.1 hypothetical protein JR316_0004339 [Psilocybe cubensis]